MLKIGFADFWPGFPSTKNFITDCIDTPFLLSEEPDVLFYSCFGDGHKKYKNSTRIFYTGENIRPSAFECDGAISFDFNDRDEANIRWPLYNLYYDPQFKPIVENRSGFCCMVVSNSRSKYRLDFFSRLSRYRKVDSGGRTLNNVGGPVKDKLEFSRNYKFCIAFENSSYPGYTTEKIIEAKKAGCIPIYWGNPLIGQDFDTDSFINLHSFRTIKHCIEYLEYVDTNEEEFKRIQERPLLRNNEYTPYSDKDNLRSWIAGILEDRPRRAKHFALAACRKKIDAIATEIVNSIEIRKIK